MLVIGGSITRYMLWNHDNHKISNAVDIADKEDGFRF